MPATRPARLESANNAGATIEHDRHRIDPAWTEPPDEDGNEQGRDDTHPPHAEEQQAHIALAAEHGVACSPDYRRERCARHGIEREQTLQNDRTGSDEGPSPGERFGCHFQVFESIETIGHADP